MLHDISNIDDIKILVDTFYIKVRKDETIGPIFNEVAKFEWHVHIPVMYTFWDSIIFGNVSYKGNPMIKHIDLARKTEMGPLQFEVWLKYWNETVDELFQGEKATEAKTRADSIANLMMHKINSELR